MDNDLIEKYKLNEFLYRIDNLISSKFLLVDRRISEILMAIANNDAIYNTIAECMVNFDFVYEWTNAVGGGQIILPNDEAKKIAFIFCLLNNIDDKNLDIAKVLENYFSWDENATAYDVFCKTIILEFKNLILKKLGMEIEDKVKELNDSTTEENIELDDFEKLADLLHKINSYIENAKRIKLCSMNRDDFISVVSTFEYAVEKKQIGYFYALCVTIKSETKKIRELQSLVLELERISMKIIKEC